MTFLFQFPFYLINYNDYSFINFYNIEKGFTKSVHFFQSFGLFYFCFSGHNGIIFALHKLDYLKKQNEEKTKILFNLSIIINMVIYLIIAICGYLCSSNDIIDLAIERKRLWYKDIAMTIARILLVPLSINKIQINHNFMKNNFLKLFEKENKQIYHFLFSSITLIITTSLSSIYQNIITYISIIGSFFVIIPAFLLPPFMIKNMPNQKNIIYHFIIGLILCILGLISGILKIIDIASGNEK